MLRRIEALNYRGLKHIAQDLAPFQILVGANASGKSTFLDAIRFVHHFIRDGLEETLMGRGRNFNELLFHQKGSGFELVLEFQLPPHLVIQTSVNQFDAVRYEIMIEGFTPFQHMSRLDFEPHLSEERLWLMDTSRQLPQPQETPLPEHLLRVVRSEPYPDARLVFQRSAGIKSTVYCSERDDKQYEFGASFFKSAFNNLPVDDYRFVVASWVYDILVKKVHSIAPLSYQMKRPSSPIYGWDFRTDGSNLPFVIDTLRVEHPQVYQDWLSHVQTILPDIEDIKVIEQEYDRNLFIAIKYRQMEKPVNAWLVSDGTLYVLLLTIIAYLPDDQSIYMIEEPENGIHPLAIEGIYEVLSSAYDKQIFVATHSPLFLGLANPKEILCFSKNSDGAVEIVRGDNHPALQEWQGEIPLSTLYASGVFG